MNLPPSRYIKSSRSGGSGGNCVEWAFVTEGVVVRDSKNPDGPELTLTHDDWAALAAAAADGTEHPWVAVAADGSATITKDGVVLAFHAGEWAAFADAARTGETAIAAALAV